MTSCNIVRFRVLRGDRAARDDIKTGMVVYHGRDCYGCASEDTRRTGIEHRAFCLNETGEPFFTMPVEDVERIHD